MRRNRGALGVLAFAIVLAIVYYACAGSAGKQRELEDRAIARARVAVCMTGTFDRIDARRLRATMIAAKTSDPEWPKRCAPYAAALEADVEPTKDRLAPHLEANELLQFMSFRRELVTAIEPNPEEPAIDWASATRDVPPPPKPASLVGELSPLAFSAMQLDVTGDTDLAIVFDDHVACRFAANGAGLESTARCSFPANAFVGARTRELATSDRASELFVVGAGDLRAFTTGEVAIPGNVIDATAYAGTLTALTPTALVHRDATNKLTTIPVRTQSGRVLRDQLITSDGKQLVARSFAGGVLGPPVVLAKGDGFAARACFSKDVLAFRIEEGDSDRVAIHANGRWRVTDPMTFSSLQCQGAVAIAISTTAGESGLEIRRNDCTVDTCTASAAMLADISANAKVDVEAMGDAVVVAWASDLVYVRIAPLAKLATTPAVPIYDGFHILAKHDFGLQQLVHAVHVLVRGTSAIVVTYGDGGHAIHVTRDGVVTGVTPIFE